MINPDKTALIIGAGIAGSSLAYQLAKRNYQVTLLDENNQHEIEIFQNKAAMISPHFMLNNPKYNSLMSKASKYAYDRVLKLGEDPEFIYTTGCPSIDLAKSVLESHDHQLNPIEELFNQVKYYLRLKIL